MMSDGLVSANMTWLHWPLVILDILIMIMISIILVVFLRFSFLWRSQFSLIWRYISLSHSSGAEKFFDVM